MCRKQTLAGDVTLRCAVNKHLREMSRDGLQHVFRSGVERWNKCKLCEGRYFEKE